MKWSLNMLKSYAAIPLVAPFDVFNVYTVLAEDSIKRGDESVDEASLPALMLPALHGAMAPVKRDIVDRVVAVISSQALTELESRIGYSPTLSDVAAALRRVFGERIDVRVLVSRTAAETAVVLYAMSPLEEYVNQVVAAKGWIV